MRRMLQRIGVLAGLALLAACSRGPDEAGLAKDAEARLDALFGARVLELRSLKRQGSAPHGAAQDGSAQAIVYFNGIFRFAQPYDPTDWEGLSPRLIASTLGATDDGVIGLKAGRIEPGTDIRVYGSIIYRKTPAGWVPTELQSSRPSSAAIAATRLQRSRADELVERLAQLVDKTPGLQEPESGIVAEELDRALQNITLRLDEGRQGVLVATGPEGGEYTQFVDSLQQGGKGAVAFRVATTEGSVANAFLIDRGMARFGLVQSDVAAAAVTGQGIFGSTGPMRHLRAVASLFPEPVHVVVRADSGIDSVAQLAGRRVAAGNPGSGTRHTALQVLAAHGLGAGSYVETSVADPLAALAQLGTGQTDAVIEVVSAPWSGLMGDGSGAAFRVLPLDPESIGTITAAVHGLVPLSIPARTYAGQPQDVPTVAATALLVANSEVTDASVESTLDLLFGPGDAARRGASAARLSLARAQAGLTLPLHDAAARYFRDRAAGPN